MSSQSIILNLNKEFASSEAHSYFQPVSQAFDIGKEAEVCLYGAALQRKPILVDDVNQNNGMSNITIRLDTLPSDAQLGQSLLGSKVHQDNVIEPAVATNFSTFDYAIEQASYTVSEFANRLVMENNATVTQKVNGKLAENAITPVQQVKIDNKPVRLQLPYAMTYKEDDFYLGWQGVPFNYIKNDGGADKYPTQILGNIPNCQLFNVDNTELKGTPAIIPNVNTLDCPSVNQFTANATVNHTNWETYHRLSDSPIFPLMKQNIGSDQSTSYGMNQSFFEFRCQFDDSVTGATDYEIDWCVGFTNTFLQSEWTADGTPDTNVITPPGLGGVTKYPPCLLGIRINEIMNTSTKTVSYIEIFCPTQLTEYIEYLDDTLEFESIFQDDLISLARIDMLASELNGATIGFRFVAHENYQNVAFHQFQNGQGYPASSQDEGGSLFGRAYSFQVYTLDVDGQRVLYDSVDRNIYFNGQLLDDCCFFNAVKSSRTPAQQTTYGLQPYWWVNKAVSGDNLCSLRMNPLVVFDNTDNEYTYRVPVQSYAITKASKSVREVLGVGTEEPSRTYHMLKDNADYADDFIINNYKVFNPNAYPRNPTEAGFSKLYSDNTQYNIELNLPIKAYNTTSGTPNNIGQKRTIVYKTEPFIDGEAQGISQTYVNKNIVPNNLKFLTLNNSEPLNLNNMAVQIRRSNTNELATELEDASVELLVKSK